jgi:two-component system, NtrC family, C4-dicarboxylate transport sensor histidine kinase DctB
VNATVRNGMFMTIVALAFIAMLLLYLRQRRRTFHANLAAKEALQRANDELERKVTERTSELVQAGKMAVLGQMSAGITHELNQPLAAMRTLSDNAQLLLARNRTADVKSNLVLISQLTERMGKITGQLKAFARKSPLRLEPVSVARATANALALVAQRLRAEHVDVLQDLPEHEVMVMAEGNRLEQVLVNLIVNALDAMQDATPRKIVLSVGERGGRVEIAVADTGSGISPAVRDKLFEPFITSKEPGAGLGLGLAISAGIVRDFGGTLRAANRPDGGAEFTIELASAKEPTHA